MTKVLYIGGYSRSGSTLLDRRLGQIRPHTSTGELGYTTHSLKENQLRCCGARFFDWPFWTRVGQEDSAAGTPRAADELIRLYPQVSRHQYISTAPSTATCLRAPSRGWHRSADSASRQRRSRYGVLLDEAALTMKDSVDAVVLKGTISPPLTAFRSWRSTSGGRAGPR